MNEWVPLLAVTAAVATLMFGFFKWGISWSERRHESHERRFVAHDNRIEQSESLLDRTREELHRDFVRQSALDKLRAEQRSDFQSVFKRQEEHSKVLNQVVGAIKGKKNV